MDKCALCLVARIDKERYGGTFDDVWLGKELHDWLLNFADYRCEAGEQRVRILRP